MQTSRITRLQRLQKWSCFHDQYHECKYCRSFVSLWLLPRWSHDFGLQTFRTFCRHKIFKRLQFSSCNFIGGSRRCRRFRRLSQLVIGRVNNVFFPVCRSYRETRATSATSASQPNPPFSTAQKSKGTHAMNHAFESRPPSTTASSFVPAGSPMGMLLRSSEMEVGL